MNIKLLQESIDFYNQGNSMAKTCKKYKTCPKTLKLLFLQSNVHIRNQHEQAIIENINRTKTIDHTYFSTLNNENSYYLGFFAADATVRKNRNEIKIGLSKIDEDFLVTLKERLKSDKAIHSYVSNAGFECVEFSFSSLQIKEDLSKYGIVPNKTYKGLDLNLIPEKFKPAFIKGFIDGDGSISYNKNTKQVKLSIVSHTQNILKQINLFFNNKGYIYSNNKNNTILYSLEFSTLPSLEILENLYSIDTPCLIRKHRKYLDILELRNKNPRDKNSSDEEEKIC